MKSSSAEFPGVAAPRHKACWWGARLLRAARRHPRWLAAVVLTLFLLGGVALWVAGPWRGRAGRTEDSGSAHWEQAQQALAARDLAQARQHLGACLKAWPLNAEVHFLMARTCRRDDDFACWRSQLRKAEMLQWPAEQILLESRLRQSQTGNVGGVEEPLRAALEAMPDDDVVILEALVKGYLQSDRLNDMMRLTARWIERHPDDWLAKLYRGRAFQGYKMLGEAIREYQGALEFKPDGAQAHLWLAESLQATGQVDEALGHYQAYLRDKRGDAEALIGAADCQLRLGRARAATATLDDLDAAHKDDAGGLLIRAKLELAAGMPAEALKLLQRARARPPQSSEVLHSLVRALRQLHKNDEADKYQRQFQELSAREAKLVRVKDQIAKAPLQVSLRYKAAVLSLELGLDGQAAHWFQTVLWLDPDHRASHEVLADYWQNHGNPKRAAYHRRRAAASRRR